MGDTNNQTDALAGQSQDGKKDTPITYIVGTPEYDKHVNDLKAQWGRGRKAESDKITTLESSVNTLTSERDSLKTQIEGLQEAAKKIEDTGGEAAELQKIIRETKAKAHEYDIRIKDLEPRETKWHEAELSANAKTIAAEFKENNPEMLIKLCTKAKVKYDDEAGIRDVIEDLHWTPIAAKQTPPPPVANNPPAPGKNNGASGELTPEMVSKLSPEERWKRRDEIKKMSF